MGFGRISQTPAVEASIPSFDALTGLVFSTGTAGVEKIEPYYYMP